MKRLLFLGLAIFLTAPTKSSADGCFVAPKFVWDKHKDINEPTQKAILVYDAGREDLILQVKYEGPVDEFGWLIPVPNLPQVQRGSMKCFYELSQYTQKHFETEWQHSQTKGSPTLSAAGNDAAGKPEPPVKVIEIKTIGAYEIAVLSTKDSGALAKWLETNQFYFPTNKADVIDSYVQQHWYFVAVKINLKKSTTGLSTTVSKLAGGELNPLQISFANDKCVFPLKISSVNGKPSEIQVYVLSPEPLLEKTMLEKKLPLIYSNNLAQAARRAQSFKNMRLLNRSFQMQNRNSPPPLLSWEENTITKMRETPGASPDELLPFAKVTKADLPDSSKWIPRLADKSWWLTKQTWKFKPEEMHDLKFEPAISVFSKMLDSKHGYFAAASLAPFGSDAVPALLTALQNTNPTVRINVVSILDPMSGPIRDSRLTAASVAWLKDSEPEVRAAAVKVLADYSNWNPKFVAPLVETLSDKDVKVRWAAENGLEHHLSDIVNFVPQFQALLKDKNPGIQACGFEILHRLRVSVTRDDLLAIFKAPSLRAVWDAYTELKEVTGEDISDADAVSLLQNPDPDVRGGIGLRTLYQNADKRAVEMALPLLKDPEPLVRMRAAQTLRALTGQHFTDEQAGDWEKWWNENKMNFTVQLHPEELRPQRRETNDFRWYSTNHLPAALPLAK